MVDDASLDDFANADDETGEAGDEASGAGDSDERPATDDGAVPPASVEPAVSTADWTTEGAECAACGEVVERRWRDDRGLVCPACKDW